MDSDPKAKRFKRKLTPFLCHEMLYDYVTEQLDPERRAAVEEFIATDKESQEILEAIRKGIEFSTLLARTQLQPQVITHVSDSENAISLGRRYASWAAWPDVVRWSITAVLVSSMVAGFISVVPWQNLPLFRSDSRNSEIVELAEVPTSQQALLDAAKEGEALAQQEGSGDEAPGDRNQGESLNAGNQIAKNESEESGDASGDDQHDEELGQHLGEDAVSAHETAKPAANQIAKTTVAGFGKAQPLPQITIVPTVDIASNVSPSTNTAKQIEPDPAGVPSKRDSKPKGYVYRAFMTLSNLDEIGPKIADAMTELGAEKAGDVELGWKRGTGRYYHFSLPEVNEKKVLDKLQVYGPVRISKDPHPRVMPEGQVRFILWVESAN